MITYFYPIRNIYPIPIIFDQTIINCLIKQLLYHESRHFWQAEHDFNKGEKIIWFKNPFSCHGQNHEEEDANDFAIRMAKGKKEKAVFMMMKYSQDKLTSELPKVFMKKEDINEIEKEIKKYRRMYRNV
jgi:hypothetical protein